MTTERDEMLPLLQPGHTPTPPATSSPMIEKIRVIHLAGTTGEHHHSSITQIFAYCEATLDGAAAAMPEGFRVRPVSVGGDDSGPGPYDFLLTGLGACTSMTMRMYADRKGWPLESVRVTLRHSRIHAKDCADCETTRGFVDQIDRGIELTGDLDDIQLHALPPGRSVVVPIACVATTVPVRLGQPLEPPLRVGGSRIRGRVAAQHPVAGPRADPDSLGQVLDPRPGRRSAQLVGGKVHHQ